MSNLTIKEQAALAMHELMKREQEKSLYRVREQRRINSLSDEELKNLVELMPATTPKPTEKGQ